MSCCSMPIAIVAQTTMSGTLTLASLEIAVAKMAAAHRIDWDTISFGINTPIKLWVQHTLL